MITFVLLIVLFVLVVAFFLVYPILKRKFLLNKFEQLIAYKVERIAKQKSLNYIKNAKLLSYGNDQIPVKNIVFGNKFIYAITSYTLIGNIDGEVNDNSWLFKKRGGKTYTYLDNLFEKSTEMADKFSEIIGGSHNELICISVIPNECNYFITENKNNNHIIVNYSELKKLIINCENSDIKNLDSNQNNEIYEMVRNKNEQDKRHLNI